MNPITWTPEGLDSLAGQRVLVVGDLILDRYIWGRADRASPEAPVLVVEYESEHVLLGGAGNVVNNLFAAGATAVPFGVVGRDANGEKVRELLRGLGAPVGGLLVDASRPTIEKTRLLAGSQQILRIDREDRRELDDNVAGRLLKRIERELDGCSGVIFSDYLKGVLSPELIARVVEMCRHRKLQTCADPKGTDYRRYRGVAYITPNQKEAQAASGVAIGDEASLARAGRALLRRTQGRGVVVTRGHEGSSLFLRRGKSFYAPAVPREVFDVTGAGDTFISYFALAVFAGRGPEAGAVLGNLAGGLAVEKIGAAPVTREEIDHEISGVRQGGKMRTLDELEGVCARLRSEGKSLVMVHGSFDLLHAGHIRFLTESRRLGDALVVSVYTDRAIRRIKGPERPFLALDQRVELLSAIDGVDYLVACDADDPQRIVKALKPDVLASGKGHFTAEQFYERMVRSHGGELRTIKNFPAQATAAVAERLRRHNPDDNA